MGVSALVFLAIHTLLASQQSTFTAAATTTTSPKPAAVSTVYQFPTGTWLENIDQRASGEILTTELNVARLWQLDPRKPPTQEPVLVASIPEKTGLTGITEIAPDVFAVIAGNVTLSTLFPGPKPWSIYKVDLNKKPAQTSKIADVPEAPYLNGMTFIPGSAQSAYPQGLILSTDSLSGIIWSVDVATSKHEIWLNNPSFIPCLKTGGPGLNGISYVDAEKRVYFANLLCNAGYLASVAVNPQTGKPAGAPTIVGGQAQRDFPDDFDIDATAKKAYVAAGPVGRVDVVDLVTGKSEAVAGAFLSGEIPEATAVRIGRTQDDIRQDLFYVSTAGLVGLSVTRGSVLAIRKSSRVNAK